MTRHSHILKQEEEQPRAPAKHGEEKDALHVVHIEGHDAVLWPRLTLDAAVLLWTKTSKLALVFSFSLVFLYGKVGRPRVNLC